VIDDASSTLVIPNGAKARRDVSGNLVVDLRKPREARDGVSLTLAKAD
jgi:hypothetical protein